MFFNTKVGDTPWNFQQAKNRKGNKQSYRKRVFWLKPNNILSASMIANLRFTKWIDVILDKRKCLTSYFLSWRKNRTRCDLILRDTAIYRLDVINFKFADSSVEKWFVDSWAKKQVVPGSWICGRVTRNIFK